MLRGNKRIWVKSITMRIASTVASFLIGWVLTGNMLLGLTLGATEFVVKFILYYFHEVIWSKIDYGRNIKKPEEKVG